MACSLQIMNKRTNPSHFAQAGGSTSSRAQGQAKPVPDRLVGELARFACRSGSKGMERVVTDFTAIHPEASKRQVEKKIQVSHSNPAPRFCLR